MKRIYSLICIILTLSLLLSACGAVEIIEPANANNDYGADLQGNGGGALYSKTKVILPDVHVSLMQAVKINDSVIMLGFNDEYKPLFYTMNIEDYSVTSLKIVEPSGEVLGVSDSPTGELLVLTIDEAGVYYLYVYQDGMLKHNIAILEDYSLENSLIIKVLGTADGYIAITPSKVIALDENGKYQKDIVEYQGIADCFHTARGELLLAITDGNADEARTSKIMLLDDKLDIKSTYAVPNKYIGYYPTLHDGASTILCTTSDTLFVLNYQQNSRTAIVDAFASGMNASNLIEITDSVYFSLQRGQAEVWQKVEAVSTNKIKLATYNISPDLTALVQAYNASNTEYKIDMVDYAKYDEADKPDTGITMLNADIIAGNIPDIFDLSNLPYERYAALGLLEDLKPYFGDGIEYTDLTESVANILTYKGGLYYIAPSYRLFYVCGDKSVVGDKGSWSIADFLSVSENIPSTQLFGPEMTQEKFLQYLILFVLSDYVDVESASCDFEAESFKQLLEFTSSLPTEYNPSEYMSQSWARAYTGNQLLLTESLGNYATSWMSFNDVIFSGDAQYVGFPSNDSNGIALYPMSLIGIAANSKVKDGAWDFVKFTLSESSQSDMSTVQQLPITKRALEKRVDYWLEQYKAKAPTLNSVYENAPIEIHSTTDPNQLKTKLYELIDRIDNLYYWDEALVDIFVRNLPAYFAGACTVDEAAKVIQERASIYISEQFG